MTAPISTAPSCANMTFAASSATTLHRGRRARARPQLSPRLLRREGAKRIAVGRDGRIHSPELEAALVEGLTAGGLDVVRIGMGPLADALFRGRDARRRRRHPGHRQPQPGRLQRLQDAAERPLGVRRGDPGPRPPRRRRRLERWRRARSPTPTSSTQYVDRLLKGFDGKAFRIGWDAGNGAGGPALERLRQAPPRRASRALHRGRRHFPQPPSRPDGRSQPRRLEEARRREEPRLRHRLRRRRRPHRRGRRPGPRDLGRPVADASSPGRCSRTCPARRSSPTSRPARPCSTASPKWAARP